MHQTKNMIRFFEEEFCMWNKYDRNVSKVRNTLRTHPDLVNKKDRVIMHIHIRIHIYEL